MGKQSPVEYFHVSFYLAGPPSSDVDEYLFHSLPLLSAFLVTI